VGGGVEVGEAYEEAAAREPAEELGVPGGAARFVFKFLCRGAISPSWLGVHEAVVAEPLRPDPAEIAWHGWVGERELQEAFRRWVFVPDAVDVMRRCPGRRAPSAATPRSTPPLS
jgi:8-oxo-dGTP pyrophosphatase MutT (NUDIX family)